MSPHVEHVSRTVHGAEPCFSSGPRALAILDFLTPSQTLRLPWWLRNKASACSAGDTRWSLGREDPLEKEMAAHSRILVWEIRGQRSLADYSPWVCKGVEHDLPTKQKKNQCLACSFIQGLSEGFLQEQRVTIFFLKIISNLHHIGCNFMQHLYYASIWK